MIASSSDLYLRRDVSSAILPTEIIVITITREHNKQSPGLQLSSDRRLAPASGFHDIVHSAATNR
jgi:hypothetical protein